MEQCSMIDVAFKMLNLMIIDGNVLAQTSAAAFETAAGFEQNFCWYKMSAPIHADALLMQ